ncbi:MAG: PQQ-dependent sugar dehydrogenase [Verrucomicrobia bacterium]|nr:PQQ-dependent sugar dehydrogenase [Verrucomicrobiota bacterium]
MARARLNTGKTVLIDLQVPHSQEPRSNPGRHYGSRITFPGDGTVLFTIDDNGVRYAAQDLTRPVGSVIRILQEGGIPPDNPFVGVPSGLAINHGNAFPLWRGNLFADFLRSESIHRLVIENNTVAHEEPLLEEPVRCIRDVRIAPDGFIYILTEASNGGLFLIKPTD